MRDANLAGIKPAPQLLSQNQEPRILRDTAALQRGRCSVGSADYFVTINLARPSSGLTGPLIGDAIVAKLRELQGLGCWQLRTFVIMPDHLHVLFTLGERAELSDTLRRFKGPLAATLHDHGLRWQEKFLRSSSAFRG